MKFAKRILAVLMMAMVTVASMAQITTASLSGTVTDSKETIPAAVVRATYEPTGIVYHAVANNNGVYQFNNIVAGGPYTIEVSSLGYLTRTFTNVYLNLADNNRLDVELVDEVLGLNEVTVTAHDMSNMSSDRAGSVTALSAKNIAVVPTTSRSMNDIMSLTPQAATTSNGFAVGGGNYRQSNVTVDGAAFNNGFGIGSNLPAGGTPISLDALDQMAISLTPYDVRQSGFVGGGIQMTTKSGTNDWKLSVYDYFTCDKMQGKKYGEKEKDNEGNLVRPELVLSDMLKNTVGFTLGGPIVKNKLFFFVNFEYDVDNAPGQTYLARPGNGSTQEMGGQYRRPTEERMDAMAKYMKDTYGFDPGAYQNYSYNSPDWKLFGRLDWNINNNNRLTLRYSYTHNFYTTSPSSSVSPFGSNALYNRNSYGRVSPYSLYFQSACYNQEQNFGSLAAEWNTRFADGKGANTLRATWSHQYEPRSWNGGYLFPTVDILENENIDGTDTRAVYTTIGLDPFTYGNLRDVQTVQVTNDLTYQAGFNNITAGAQFEYNNAKNGYMQMGNGYFMYANWDDFVNNATPLAFAITHGNNDELNQVYPTIQNAKVSLYAQDEMNLHKNFKLTAGIRFELPFYPNLDFNENKAFTSLYEKEGWKTSDVPNAYLSVSPRVGFNWDVMGNRRIIIRGGTGLFTGNLPMVWLVSAVGNSNVMQAQTIWYAGRDDDKLANMSFPSADKLDGSNGYIKDILTQVYGGEFKQQDLSAPSATTILDKHLKLPTTWKSSLAVDFNLPENWKLSVEGIFNKDLYSVICRKEGFVCDSNALVLIPGVDERNLYTADPDKKKTNPYYLTNSKENGYYVSVTGKVEKSWNFGLNLMAAYTYSNSMTLNDGLGDQVSSVFGTNTFAKNGSNESGLGHASFVTPHRVIAAVSYRIKEGNNAATTLSLFYEGSQLGYIGSQYSYTRWTPTFSSNITGDGGSYNTIYIPTAEQMDKMNWKSDDDKAGFEQFIQEHKELASHRGEYATRGCMSMPWHNKLNFKFLQSIIVADGSGRKHNMEVGLDINNLLNLLNPAWGNYKALNNTDVLTLDKDDKTISYNPKSCQWSTLANTNSTWNMMLSLRYFF